MNFLAQFGTLLAASALAGLVCRRIGLSPVVGYLGVGVILSPASNLAPLGLDATRIEDFAQIGLALLMFAIGLRLNLRRLRALPFSLVVATAVCALAVFNGGRFIGWVWGWSSTASWVLGATLVASSSAVVIKVLTDLRRLHDETGRLAIGITLLEDLVAVLVLALLGSIVSPTEFAGSSPVVGTLIQVTAFGTLVLTFGLILFPKLIGRMEDPAGPELRTLAVVALVVGLAGAAASLGLSPALGAFFAGLVAASSRLGPAIERTIVPMRDLFAATFFVSIGLSVNLQELASSWWLATALTAAVLTLRTAGCTLALILTGSRPKTALQVGLALTPLGEFSFVICQVATAAGALPSAANSAVIGAAIATALAAPLLIRQADRISTALESRQPGVIRDALAHYRRVLHLAQSSNRSTPIVQLARPRLLQLGAELVLAASILHFAPPLLRGGWDFLQLESLIHVPASYPSWILASLAAAVPVWAAWRNTDALARLASESLAPHSAPGSPRQRLLYSTLRVGALPAFALVLSPVAPAPLFVPLLVITVLAAAVLLFGRRLVHAQSEAAGRIRAALADELPDEQLSKRIEQSNSWAQIIEEVVVGDTAFAAGRSLADLQMRTRTGATLAQIERQGIWITNPDARTILYPADRVFLVGTPSAVAQARRLLEQSDMAPDERVADSASLLLEPLPVPTRFPSSTATFLFSAGATLVAYRPSPDDPAQTVSPDTPINPGGELLALGSRSQIDRLRAVLARTSEIRSDLPSHARSPQSVVTPAPGPMPPAGEARPSEAALPSPGGTPPPPPASHA